MKSYLIFSPVGCGFYMIPHLSKAYDTKSVYYYSPHKELKTMGKGMEKYSGWNKLILVNDPFEAVHKESKEDLIIIFDDNGYGNMADYLRDSGYTVVGGGKLADTLESDRWGTIQYMKKIMNIPETEYHETFQDGISSLKRKSKEERWVFKPQDPDVPKDKTYIGKDIKDLIEAMQKFQEEWQWKDGFVLQKFIDGVEASVNAYFDGTDWLPQTFCWYFENKAFMDGDIGMATGGSMAVQVKRKNEGDMFSILDNMKPLLSRYKYNGCMDINCIFSKDDHKPYFLELTPRFGYPGLDMDITAIEDEGKSFTEFVKVLAYKNSKTEFFGTDKIQTSLTVSVSPYPSEDDTQKLKGLPLSWGEKDDKYMFPLGILYNEKKKRIELSGSTGGVLSVTCIAQNLSGAVEMTYSNYIPSINLQGKQYRSDLGKSARLRIEELKKGGIMQ